MDINITLFGQMITFLILVSVTMKFIWPKLMQALLDRENKIIQGLQAAEQGQQKLQMAENFAKNKEEETKQYCAQLITETKKQAEQILELAIIQAKTKKDKIVASAQEELEKEQIKIRKALREHVATLIIEGTEKILEKHLDETKHQSIVLDISNKIYGTK